MVNKNFICNIKNNINNNIKLISYIYIFFLDNDIVYKTCDLCLKKSGNIELLHCQHV